MRVTLRRVWLSAACITVLAGSAAAAIDVPDNFTTRTIVSGLDQPLGMAFLPDGRLLITEQHSGKLRMVVNGHIAQTDPLLVVPSFNGEGYERGFQSVAVDPGWPARPYLYLMHNRTGNFLRVVRYTASGDVHSTGGENLTLATPLILLDDLPDNQHNHNGGSMRFGPDGHLYVSIGEDTDQCGAQDSTRLKGAILELDVSQLPAGGGGPVSKALLTPSSPALVTSNANAKLVYAYGLRNPWRFQIDAQTGLLYVGDVGDATYEEMTEVARGDNLGWPFREGNTQRSAGGCSEPGGAGNGRYRAPIVTLNHSVGAKAILAAGVYRPLTGAAFRWPSVYDGDAFYSDYFTGFLRRLEKSGSNWVAAPAVSGQPNASDWATGLTSPSDFAFATDGSLWVLQQWDAAQGDNTGSVVRIQYTGAATDAPPAVAAPRLLHGRPNPFEASVELSFTNLAAGPVTLTVYDVRGRAVRQLMHGWSGSGDLRVVWDGRADGGAIAPPGVYLARLTHAAGSETLRMLRVR